MSAEDQDEPTTRQTLDEIIAGEPERPKNGQITNRMIRNLHDPEYHDPVTKAMKQKGRRK